MSCILQFKLGIYRISFATGLAKPHLRKPQITVFIIFFCPLDLMAQALQHIPGTHHTQGENSMQQLEKSPQTTGAMAIVTCSYGPDWHRCARLCASVDQHVPSGVEHLLVVPRRDRARFEALENSRRRVLTVESIVPGRFVQVPGSNRWWMDARGWPVRGWIMQQITKLSANHATDAEVIVFADSDLQFLRPLRHDDLFRDGRLRLHRIPGAKNTGEHLEWHKRAGRLLGVTPRYFGADYVGQLISWRRSNLIALHQHLEEHQGQPWYRGIARSLRFSEYILYGAFIDGILSQDRSGHFGSADDLCHCCWFEEDVHALTSGKEQIRSDALALLLQSNLELAENEELAIARNAGPSLRAADAGALCHA
jgi:hypothetical protein